MSVCVCVCCSFGTGSKKEGEHSVTMTRLLCRAAGDMCGHTDVDRCYDNFTDNWGAQLDILPPQAQRHRYPALVQQRGRADPVRKQLTQYGVQHREMLAQLDHRIRQLKDLRIYTYIFIGTH